MKNLIKKRYLKLIIKKILKKKSIKYSFLKFNSYNGRNITYTYFKKNEENKYLIKYYIEDNYDIKKEIELIRALNKNNLLNFSILFSDHKNYYIRDYLIGENAFDTINGDINNSKKIIKKIIHYIYSVLKISNDKKIVYHLDFRLNNFILDHNMNINFIDTDVSHENLTFFFQNNQGEYNYNQYKAHTFAKFLVKSIEGLTYEKSNIFFEFCSSLIDEISSVKKIILLRFFQGFESNYLDNFLKKNFYLFKDIDSVFNQKVTIDLKLSESLILINDLKYVVARRYNWLDDESQFKSKDIDIICEKNDLIKIISAFYKNGWDVYNNRISQYFERYKTIIKIDLNTVLEKNDKNFFNEIVSNYEIKKNIKIKDELNYFKIIIKNSFKKKYLKQKYFSEFQKYFKINNPSRINQYAYLLKQKKYQYKNFYYFSFTELIKRKLKDFIRNKKIIFVGADGAGKSTNVELISNYLNNFVSVEKKYFGNFFLPSGRTNLLIIKTSLLFRFIMILKNKFKINHNKVNKINDLKIDKKLLFLKSNTYQLFVILFLPIFLLDITIHKIITRLTISRFTICDRYYDDILLNYRSKKIKKILIYFI